MGDASGRDDPFEEDRTADAETHRSAFGEYGGESRGLIERTFRERIVLAGVALGRDDPEVVDASMDELARLVDTAGADPVARVLQQRDTPDIATYVGSGKAAEIRDVSEVHDADTVVFDNELTPAQQGNLETILKRSARRAAASAPGAPARPSWRSTGAGSCVGSAGSSRNWTGSGAPGTRSPRRGGGPATARWRSWATRTPASRRC